MFQFPPFALTTSVTHLQCAGLPHSEITGSKPVCSSPVLIAAYHVLRRLQKPRHPPFALVTFSLLSWLNHKNLSCCFTLVLIYSLPWNCSPQHQNDRLSIISRFVTDYLISSLTLPRYLFSNLSMNLPLFLKRAAKIRTFFYPPNFSDIFLHFFSIFFNPQNVSIWKSIIVRFFKFYHYFCSSLRKL